MANDLLLATYGNYVTVVNTESGNYDGAWDLSAYLGDGVTAVGICYATSQENTQYGYIDYCIILDSSGQLWLMGVAESDGSFLRTTPRSWPILASPPTAIGISHPSPQTATTSTVPCGPVTRLS